MKYKVEKAVGSDIVEAYAVDVAAGGVLVFSQVDGIHKMYARHAWVTVERIKE